MLGDSDREEEKNIKQEESLSTKLYTRLTSLRTETDQLRKEFKHLLKTGKELRSIIRNKEKANRKELEQIGKLQAGLSQASVKNIEQGSGRLKREERQESRLSREEALVLQKMLNELHDTYKHGEGLIASDKELYDMIRELYDEALADYQLEVQDIERS